MINYFSSSDLTDYNNGTFRSWVLVFLIMAMFLVILIMTTQLGIDAIHGTGSWGRSLTQVIMQRPAI